MKKLFIAIVAIFTSFCTFSQTRADYDKAIARFQKFYNQKNDDSIDAQFDDEWHKERKRIWSKGECETIYKDYGKMLSFEYIIKDKELVYYKTTFEKSIHMHSFSLDKSNKFGTHRFETSDPEIDSLLISKHIQPVKVIKRAHK